MKEMSDTSDTEEPKATMTERKGKSPGSISALGGWLTRRCKNAERQLRFFKNKPSPQAEKNLIQMADKINEQFDKLEVVIQDLVGKTEDEVKQVEWMEILGEYMDQKDEALEKIMTVLSKVNKEVSPVQNMNEPTPTAKEPKQFRPVDTLKPEELGHDHTPSDF